MAKIVWVYGKEVDQAKLRTAAPGLLASCIWILDVFDNVRAPYRKKNLAPAMANARRCVGEALSETGNPVRKTRRRNG